MPSRRAPENLAGYVQVLVEVVTLGGAGVVIDVVEARVQARDWELPAAPLGEPEVFTALPGEPR